MVTYRTLHVPLFISHSHSTIIEHALDVIPQGRDVLGHALAEIVDFVLQLGALLARLFIGSSSVISYLGV